MADTHTEPLTLWGRAGRALDRLGEAPPRPVWLAVALVTLLAWAKALNGIRSVAVPTRDNTGLLLGADFRDAAYYPIKQFLAGGNPYDPAPMFADWPVGQHFDLYAPVHLLLWAPLVHLPYTAAFLVFSLINLSLLTALGVVSARVLDAPGRWITAWAVGAGVVLSANGNGAVYSGQINPLICLGAIGVLLGIGRSDTWCAVGLALTWIKPQYGIPLTVLALARGAWRPAVRGLVLVAVTSLPAVLVLIVRNGGIGELVEVVHRNLTYATSSSYDSVTSANGLRTDLAAVGFRITGITFPGAELVALLLVLGTAATLLGRRSRRRLILDPAELVLASLAILLCMVHQSGEGLTAVPGLVAVAALLLRGGRPRPALTTAALLSAIPFIHLRAVQRPLIRVFGDAADRQLEGAAMAVAFVLTVVAITYNRRTTRLSPNPPEA